MKEESLVTVGVPTYNRPEGLRRTLERITGQTYKNLEIIISDNCSPGPETEAVAREFMRNDSRIQYFCQKENKGILFNWRFVLKKAAGEYFMWAADDDELDLRYVEICLEKLSDNNRYGVVFTRYKITSPYGKKLFLLNHNIYLKSKYKKLVFLFLDECLTHKSNVLYGAWRTEIIKKVFFSKLIKVEHVGKGQDGAITLLALGMTDAYQVQQVLFTKTYSSAIPGSLREIVRSSLQNVKSALTNPILHFTKARVRSRQFVEIIAPFYSDQDTISMDLIFFVKRIYHIVRYSIF